VGCLWRADASGSSRINPVTMAPQCVAIHLAKTRKEATPVMYCYKPKLEEYGSPVVVGSPAYLTGHYQKHGSASQGV
jgi:hypothetical protein